MRLLQRIPRTLIDFSGISNNPGYLGQLAKMKADVRIFLKAVWLLLIIRYDTVHNVRSELEPYGLVVAIAGLKKFLLKSTEMILSLPKFRRKLNQKTRKLICN